MLSENTENNDQKLNSPSIQPSCFIHPCKIFIHPRMNHSTGKITVLQKSSCTMVRQWNLLTALFA